MPNRTLRDSIRTSESLSRLTGDEERHFHRLVLVAGDHGRFDARYSVLLAGCYPLHLKVIDEDDVRRWTQRLADPDVDIIQLYEVDGKPYGVFINWFKYQRKRDGQSKYPEPPICGGLPQPADNVRLTRARPPKSGSDPVNRKPNTENGSGAVVELPVPEEVPGPEKAESPSAAPEWLLVLSELQRPTPADVVRLTRWAEPPDEETLRETAYSLVEKWSQVKHRYKSPFATFQSWVRVAERGPPNSAHPPRGEGKASRRRCGNSSGRLKEGNLARTDFGAVLVAELGRSRPAGTSGVQRS